MSLQLTLARGAARNAETAWKRHLADCVTCRQSARSRQQSARSRQRSALCAAGNEARRELDARRADLERERELDMRPIDGQGVLW